MKPTSERQRDYRSRRKDDAERLSMYLSVTAKRKLERLARHHRVTQRTMLERLLTDAESNAVAALPPESHAGYYADVTA